MTENARKMADTNFSMEQVARIDKITNKYFPATKNFFDRTSETGRKEFLEDLDKTLFKGDLNKEGLDKTLKSKLLKSMNKAGVPGADQSIIFKGLKDTRQKFKELLEITAGGPGAKTDLPAGVAVDLRALMGDRIKNYIGNTYELFQNSNAGLFNKFKPAKEDKDFVANMFMRYAAKNKNPINKLEADGMVDDIMDSARNMDPKKDTLPTFNYQNLTKSADSPYNIKTFAQTLEKETAGGDKTLRVIGKGSKAFRKLFGEVEDVRHSIYEGVNRLSVVARKNQLFDEILDVDEAMKSTMTAATPAGARGFFHSTPLEARRAFGDIPGKEIVKIDPYVEDYFKDGILVNRLKGMYTTRDIAEGFSNVSKMQEFMRGETGGALGKTFSWAWRNLLLTPKAGAQYAKTILSIPTHIRNFLSSAAFALGNGTLFENPQLMKEAMARAGATIQMGVRNPLSMERYRRYLELGVTNTNTRLGDLRNLFKDIRFGEGNIATDSVLRPMLNSLGAFGKGVKKGAKFMQDAYVAEDDFWKIFNFEVEYGRLFNINKAKNLKLSNEAMDQMAAKIVRNTVPNYAYVGELVRAARMSPFGNFMSWPSEIYRTGVGIVRQALDEIADPITKKINPITSKNPMKGVGMKRLIGMTLATAAVPYGVIKGSQAIFGVSNEEADAANDFVAPWAKDSQKIYMRDPETDELYYIDYSKNNVYDTLTRPFQTILRNIQEGVEDEDILLKGFAEGIAQAAGQVAEPFVSEAMFTEAFMDIYARNGMTNEGVEIYSEQTPESEKYQRIFKHLGKTLMPTTKPFQRLSQAIKETPSSTGEFFKIGHEMAGIMGWRPVKVDPEKALGFYIYDFQRGISKARKEFTGGPEGLLKGGPKTPQEVIERLFVANQASFNVQKEMLRHFQNAQKIGLSRSQIKKSLEKRGIPESTIDDLFKGDFKFFFPSEAIQDRFKEIAREGGIPNPFLQSKGILQSMRNAFKGLSLYRDFPLTLEDFMPPSNTYDDQSSLPTPPLGNTPMPAKMATNTMQKDPQTNLTRTETALLSPTEKVIAGRT
jgi:predicted GNAT family acetyltransferase